MRQAYRMVWILVSMALLMLSACTVPPVKYLGSTTPQGDVPMRAVVDAAPLVEAGVAQGSGRLALVVKWPSRRTVQAIPASTEALQFRLRAGDTLVEKWVARAPEVATTSVVFEQLPVGPAVLEGWAWSGLDDTGVATTSASVVEAYAVANFEVLENAASRVRLVFDPPPVDLTTSIDLEWVPSAVRQSGSIKVFATVGNQTFEADYGSTVTRFGTFPNMAINLFSDTSSPVAASFQNLPLGFAKVTARAYDGRDGSGTQRAEATANVNLVPGAGNKARLSFIRSGEPRLLGVYEQVGSDATASVDAAPTGFLMTLHVEDILEPGAPDSFKIFVGGVQATSVMNGLTDAGRGMLQFPVLGSMTKGKIQLVNGGATASLQPDFKRISRFSISPTTADLSAGGSQTFVGKCFDTDNAEFVPQNPKITFKVNADPLAEPDFFSTNPESRRELGTVTQSGVYTAPSQAPASGLDKVYFGISDWNQATASVFIN